MASKEFRNDPRRARLESLSKPAPNPVVINKPKVENKPTVEAVVKKSEKKN